MYLFETLNFTAVWVQGLNVRMRWLGEAGRAWAHGRGLCARRPAGTAALPWSARRSSPSHRPFLPPPLQSFTSVTVGLDRDDYSPDGAYLGPIPATGIMHSW